MKPKINLEHTPEILNEFILKIESVNKNVFSIYNFEIEQDIMFSKDKWIFILFAGYSGPDIKMVEEVLEISNQFPNLNFAFKPFMDDRKIQDFTEVSVLRKVTPIILKREDNITELISSSIKSKSEIEELISLI